MKYITLSLCIVLLFLSSCKTEGEDLLTHKEDYNKYLTSQPANTTSKYFELWNSKIKPDSSQLMSFGIVGGEYNRYFQNTGDIQYLKKAEQVLKKAVDIAAIGKAGYYRALARNYVSQHRFREAAQLADSARTVNSGVDQTLGLLFDVNMELGNYSKAESYLDSLKNMNDFGYLIRLAKWNDYKGDLDTTIRFMEKAKQKADDSKNKELRLWAYTNLADYYGHAGRIEDSYKHYLKALELDPGNAYAKKGIAWIVFSHEKKAEEAMRILDSVTKTYKAPDYYLLKAEIADFMGDDLKSLSNFDAYFEMVKNPAYGDMYNAYNVSLYLDRTDQFDKALQLSREEVGNRPTPEAYSLLAYSHFKKGDKEKALEIVQEYIEGKTFEPGILLYAAEIYKATGQVEKAEEIKAELVGAVYELGPSSEKSIMNL
ncbi:tetratricopeptide repeat protein [Zobellia russellii]|uniref:tetratricopeptide repeat protein n=1 Tax=Zobellia russellii TaxID=248907 RepID=UPI0037DC54BF